jgi:PAS domain-containing protein
VVVPGRETSVLGRLAQTQASLAHMDSERRRARAERLESLRESQTLMEAINIYSIVSMTDLAGTITYANDMFSRVSGYSNAELVGQNHRILNSRTQPAGYWKPCGRP